MMVGHRIELKGGGPISPTSIRSASGDEGGGKCLLTPNRIDTSNCGSFNARTTRHNGWPLSARHNLLRIFIGISPAKYDENE